MKKIFMSLPLVVLFACGGVEVSGDSVVESVDSTSIILPIDSTVVDSVVVDTVSK